MQVSVEVTGGLQRRMTVGVPKDRIEQEIETRLKSLARSTRINGFRPGKAPVRLIKQRFGGQVRQEVVGEIVQETLHEAILQQKLRVASQPMISSLDDHSDQVQLAYTVEFEVYPELETVHSSGLNVEKPVAQVTESDVDAMIESLRKQRQTWVATDRSAQDGDQLLVDYVGTIDGAEFPGGTAKQRRVVLGSGQYVGNFESSLVGSTAGSTVEFDVTFPDDYNSAEVAGKSVHFSVQVHSIMEPSLPEINDEFAHSFEVKEGGVAGLRAEIRKNLERELDREIKSNIKSQVLSALLEKNPLDVPSALVQAESKQMAESMNARFSAQGIRVAKAFEPDAFLDEATKRVKTGVLMMELVRKFNLKPDSAKMRKLVEEHASSYENPEEFVHWYYEDKQRLADVEMAVLEEQAVELLLNDANVVEKPMSFDQLVKKQQD